MLFMRLGWLLLLTVMWTKVFGLVMNAAPEHDANFKSFYILDYTWEGKRLDILSSHPTDFNFDATQVWQLFEPLDFDADQPIVSTNKNSLTIVPFLMHFDYQNYNDLIPDFSTWDELEPGLDIMSFILKEQDPELAETHLLIRFQGEKEMILDSPVMPNSSPQKWQIHVPHMVWLVWVIALAWGIRESRLSSRAN